MLSTEELRSTLIEALFHYRSTLAINEGERRDDLPRKGKMPATENDALVQRTFQVQFEAVNRFLESVDDMINVVIKPTESLISRAQTPSSDNLRPFTDPYICQNDDPFINPFSGQLIEPITLFSPGPSTREDPPRDTPARGLGLEEKDSSKHFSPSVSTPTPQEIPQTQNLNPPDLKGRYIKLSGYHKKLEAAPLLSDIPSNSMGVGNHPSSPQVTNPGVERWKQGQASNFTFTNGADLPANTATEKSLPAAPTTSQTTSETARLMNQSNWKSWIPGGNVGEARLKGFDPSELPGLNPAGRDVEPRPPAPISASQIYPTPTQPVLENNHQVQEESDEEDVDFFFPRKPRSGARAPGSRPLRVPKPPRSKSVLKNRKFNHDVGGTPLPSPMTLLNTNSPKIAAPSNTSPLERVPPKPVPLPVTRPSFPIIPGISQFATEFPASVPPLPAQAEKSQNWWEIPEEEQKHDPSPPVYSHSKFIGSLGGGSKDVHKTNFERNPSNQQRFETTQSHRFEKDLELAKQLASESHVLPALPIPGTGAPSGIIPGPQQSETEHQYFMRLQREEYEQIARDMALAKQLALELSTETCDPRKLNDNILANPRNPEVIGSRDSASQLTQLQSDREFAEQIARSFDQRPDPETLALLAMLSDGVPQDYDAFREHDAATERLIAELSGGASQNLDQVRKLQKQDRELARQLADQEVFAKKTQRMFEEEHKRQLQEQETFARNTQRMYEDEHRRHMEEEAAAARKAQEEWNKETIKREEEARRQAEALRQEEAKRREAARRKLEEKARAAREAEVRRKEEERKKVEAAAQLKRQAEKKAKEEEERRRKERMATCLVCQEEGEKSRMAILSCTHAYCGDCIKRAFTQAMKSKSPFRCCSPVPIKSVEKHFKSEFVAEYSWLVLELQTPNPLYCAVKGCSKFVPPNSIHGDIGTCRTCLKRTCRHCRALEHEGICTADKESAKVHELARKNGWKPCPGCRNMIERNDGCLHMTCIKCRTEFCYNCGRLSAVCPGNCRR